MGLDAWIKFETKKKLTEEELEQIKYDLITRFEQGEKRNFCCDTISHDEENECLYMVDYGWRYYGEDYERGDALTIFGILLYLENNDLIKHVFYGDGCFPIRLVTKKEIYEIAEHFSKVGNAGWNEQVVRKCHNHISQKGKKAIDRTEN